MSTAQPKVVTIDGEQYQLIEIWADFWMGDAKGKQQVYTLRPLAPQPKVKLDTLKWRTKSLKKEVSNGGDGE